MKQVNTALLIITVLLGTIIAIATMANNDSNTAYGATKPCSSTHNCLKNHTYADGHCTNAVGDSTNGYQIVPCGGTSPTVTPTAKKGTQNTTTKNQSQSKTDGSNDTDDTGTSQQSKNVPTVTVASNNTTPTVSSTQDIQVGTLVQKLGPYTPNPNVIDAMQKRLDAVKKGMNGKYNDFHVNVVLDVFKGTDSTLHVLSACYVQCTLMATTDDTTAYAIVIEGKNTYTPLIMFNDNIGITVDCNTDYIAVDEISTNGHFYLMLG